MNVFVTLKVNDTNGKLLKSVRRIFCDETGTASLDDLIKERGNSIQEYMLSCTEFDEQDTGKAIILRFHYIVLQDDEQDEPDGEYELTDENERIVVGDGHIVVEDELVSYIEDTDYIGG